MRSYLVHSVYPFYSLKQILELDLSLHDFGSLLACILLPQDERWEAAALKRPSSFFRFIYRQRFCLLRLPSVMRIQCAVVDRSEIRQDH